MPYLFLRQKFPFPACFLYFPFLPRVSGCKDEKKNIFLSFLATPPFSSRLKLFKVQLGRRTHVHGIKDSVETIKRFGMWKWSEGATVCICVAPERLPRSGGASGKGSRQSDGTTGHKKKNPQCTAPHLQHCKGAGKRQLKGLLASPSRFAAGN